MNQINLFGAAQTTKTSDDYYTPKWIFDFMGITFDLDVACPPEGPINVPAARYYTAAEDGLAQPWHGRVWMNPPYSKPSPWVERFIENGHGIALLPFAKSAWCQKLWDSDVAMVFVHSLRFDRIDPTLSGSVPFPIALYALGNDCVQAVAKLGKIR